MHPLPGGAEGLAGPGHACVAVRHEGAAHFGHVGWGVEVSHNRYLFGAVEGKTSNGSAGWFKEGSWADMLAAFQKAALRPGHAGSRYDALRCVKVASPNVGRAWAVARTMATRSRNYNLITNNCLNATYDVIHDYGTGDLPNPNIWRAPNIYFNKFDGRHEWLLHR